MNNFHRHFLYNIAVCFCILLFVGGLEAVESITTPQGVYGHPDTPKLPWCDYIKHDAHRPLPAFVETGSENISATPPSDAEVLFDGKDLSAWQRSDWKISEGVMTIVGSDLISRKSYGNCQLHLEFNVPQENQALSNRGNSGVILMGLYEVQIFDSHPSHKLQVYPDGQCAAIYGETPPLLNACRKPGQWQSFDIIFIAPVFKDGKLSKPASVTMLHNGVLVHLNTIIHGPVGWRAIAQYKPHADKLPLKLQGHGSPVSFRNVWIRPLDNSLKRNKKTPVQSEVKGLKMDANDFIKLFDGKTLNGWEVLPGGNWKVKDGAIVGFQDKTEARHGMLLSKKAYTDFIVKLKYKALKGNSGLYFRAERVDHAVSVKGFQAEIDSNGSDIGGIYETLGRAWVARVSPDKVKTFYKNQDWNEMVVKAIGKNTTVYVNGVKTVELENDQGLTKGHFGLQMHGGQDMHVEFKDIEIHDLSDDMD